MITNSVRRFFWCSSSGQVDFTGPSHGQSKNLGFFERTLSNSGFIRCHHSFLVNSVYIKAFKKGRSGIVIMQDQSEIPVSQRRMNELTDLFSESSEN